jgi:uncharacterized protein with NRDE domain
MERHFIPAASLLEGEFAATAVTTESARRRTKARKRGRIIGRFLREMFNGMTSYYDGIKRVTELSVSFPAKLVWPSYDDLDWTPFVPP